GGAASGPVVAQGSISVVHDAGLQSLPKKAPKSLLDADGRRYTVLYQNQLPELQFRWRKAPGGSMTLMISGSSGDKAKSISASGPSYNMTSGGLPDGTYEWWFEPQGGAPSPHTTLRVQFDNAAATASIKEPSVGSTWTASGDAPVHVSGIAMEGWRV